MFCCTLLYVPSSFTIILMGKRELVALLSLSSWCLVIVVWLFLAVPWVCLQFVIVVFPDHTHLFFLMQLFSTPSNPNKQNINQVRWNTYAGLRRSAPSSEVDRPHVTCSKTRLQCTEVFSVFPDRF